MMDLTFDLPATQSVILQDSFGFASWLADRGVQASSIKSYLRDLAVFSRWYADANRQPFAIQFLTSTDLRAWREHSLQVERVMPTTWNRRLAMLKNLAACAREKGLIDHDPLRGVERAADQRELAPRWVARPDASRILRQLELDIFASNTPCRRSRALRDAAMVGLMVYAGLREGEVSNLLVGDLDLGERHGQVRIHNGKGEKFRKEPLSKEARYLLNQWLPNLGAPGKGGRVFPFLSPRNIQKRFGEICERAGIDHLTPHQLRHTFVKRVHDVTGDLVICRQLAGHAKTDTTARYAQPGWDELEAAVDAAQVA